MALAEIAAISDQKQKIERYKSLQAEYLSKSAIGELKG